MTSRGKQGGFQNWQELRDHAINLFGEPPHPATEQDIIDAYEQHPDAIAKAVDRIAHDVASGTARSGWGVLRAQANTIQHAPSNPTRATGITREKAISRAEQWIRNAGCHYDRETEIQDELFGDRGPLQDHHTNQLQERILEAWRTARPTGERVEQELDARGRRWIEHQAKLRELAERKAAELEQAAQARERITVEEAVAQPAPVNAAATAPAPDHAHEEVPF